MIKEESLLEKDVLQDILLLGDNIPYNEFEIINHKLRYIFSKDMGVRKYSSLIKLSILEVEDILQIDKGVDIGNIHVFDILCGIEELRNSLNELLDRFTNLKWHYFNVLGTHEFVSSTNKNRITIGKKEIEDIFHIIQETYCVTKESNKYEDIKTKTQEGEDLLKEFMLEEEKINKNKTPSITLKSIIKGVSSRPSNYNLFNIWDLTIYQLMETFYTLNMYDNYNYSMTSVYQGIMDSKNLSKLNWASENNL